jgi:hypothetical protein
LFKPLPLLTCNFFLSSKNKLLLLYFFLMLLSFLLYYYYSVGTLWHLQKFLEYLSWIHPLHHSPLSLPSPHSWNHFNRSHFSIFVHECIVFPLHSASFTLCLCPSLSHWYQPPERTCFTFLFPVSCLSLSMIVLECHCCYTEYHKL